MNKNNSKLIIGISSRALFDLDESHEIYKTKGLDSYREYQIDNEDKILNPGKAFPLVKKIRKSCTKFMRMSCTMRVIFMKVYFHFEGRRYNYNVYYNTSHK